MNTSLSLNDQHAFSSYAKSVSSNASSMGEFARHWNIVHFALVEPYRLVDERYYDYLQSIPTPELLEAELESANDHPAMGSYKPIIDRCLFSGIHFFNTQHPNVLADFLGHEASINTPLPFLTSALMKYRAYFAKISNINALLLVDSDNTATPEIVRSIMEGAENGKPNIAIHVSRAAACPALEHICKKFLFPIERWGSLSELSKVRGYEELVAYLNVTAKYLCVLDSEPDDITRELIQRLKANLGNNIACASS